jgi:Ca2+/Na+ antiporter
MAECANIDCIAMPDSKIDMFIMLATSVVVILVYYNVHDEYSLSTKSDMMVLLLIMIMASAFMGVKNIGIYSMVMFPLLYIYAKFSDINYHLLPPGERGDGDDSD